MTETLVDTRPSNKTGSGVYNDSHVLTTRQPTPDLVPLNREAANAPALTTPSLSPEVQGSAGIPENGDVSAVVVKAKKAAQSLWVLIHAQVRNVTNALHMIQGCDYVCVCVLKVGTGHCLLNDTSI